MKIFGGIKKVSYYFPDVFGNISWRTPAINTQSLNSLIELFICYMGHSKSNPKYTIFALSQTMQIYKALAKQAPICIFTV